MKRRILSIMMVLAMCLSMYPAWATWADTGEYKVQPLAAGEFTRAASGTGTENDPYLISNADQLKALSDYINGTGDYNGEAHTGEGEYFKLTTGIDLGGNSGNQWEPIGVYDNVNYGEGNKPFSGTFDGDGCEVSGLYISKSGWDDSVQGGLGVFGYIGGEGTVKNLKVSGNISARIPSGYNVGGIVGYSEGTIEKCENAVIVTSQNYVGGIVGTNYGTVKECSNTAAFTSDAQYVGGIVGQNSGTIEGSHNDGNVTGSGNSFGQSVGGIVGNGFGTIESCYNTATVTGTASSSIGGIIGDNYGSIEKSYNSGTVTTSNTSSSKTNIGGIVGYNYGSIEKSYNNGTVKSSGSGSQTYIGGIAGYNDSYGEKIENCYNAGAVGNTGVIAGGIAGYNEYTIKNCYNIGVVTGKTLGGIIGGGYMAPENCYYLDTTAESGIGDANDIWGEYTPPESKDEDEFKSGEVAWLLQNGQDEQVWGQELTGSDIDEYPVLTDESSAEVLKFPLTYTDSDGEEHGIYSNPPGDTAEFPEGSSVTLGDTTVTLPDGGTADKNGNITPNGDIKIGDTTASILDGEISSNENGGVNVPEDTAVTLPNDTEVTLPEGGVIDKDGNIVGGTIEVGGTSVTAPDDDSVFAPDGNGNVYIPDGSTVTLGEAFDITVGDNDNKTIVDRDGNIHLPDGGTVKIGDTTITAPEGGGVIEPQSDGTVTVPDGSTVKTPGAPDIKVGENNDKTIVDKDGNVSVPENGSVEIGGTTATIPEGGTIEPNGEGNVKVPAGTKVKTSDGEEIDLPDGGIIDSKGNVTKNGDITPTPDDDGYKIGNTTIIVPEGETVKDNGDGTVTVPDGSIVKTPGAPDITVGENDDKTIVDEDGNVTVPDNGSIRIGSIIVTVPRGGTIEPDGEGNVRVPTGTKVKTPDGEEVELSDGGVIDSEGNVKDDDNNNDNEFKIGDTIIIVPEGGTVKDNGDGTVIVPKGSRVIPPKGPEMFLPDGGIVDKDGNVTLPDGGDVQIGKAVITVPEGGTIKPNGDGTVTIPEGSIVKRAGQEDVTVPRGGAVYDSGTDTLKFPGEDGKNPDDDPSKDNDDASKDEDDTQKTTDDTSGTSDDPTQNPNSAPKTGDTNSLALWITLLGLSGAVLCRNLILRKKRKNV